MSVVMATLIGDDPLINLPKKTWSLQAWRADNDETGHDDNLMCLATAA
jgi:hypothetical protein